MMVDNFEIKNISYQQVKFVPCMKTDKVLKLYVGISYNFRSEVRELLNTREFNIH